MYAYKSTKNYGLDVLHFTMMGSDKDIEAVVENLERLQINEIIISAANERLSAISNILSEAGFSKLGKIRVYTDKEGGFIEKDEAVIF